MSESPTQPLVRDWDPDRPVLAGLLARREVLGAQLVRLADAVAVFTIPSEPMAPHVSSLTESAHPLGDSTFAALASLAALSVVPQQVRESFDVGALLAEQLSDAEQVLGGLRDDPQDYTIPVTTRTQPMVHVVMPEEGLRVRLQVQVRRMPVVVHVAMPLLNSDGSQFSLSTKPPF